MNTHSEHSKDGTAQMRAAILASVAAKATPTPSSTTDETCRVTLKPPTSRQIADALVRWITTGARG